MLLLLWIGYADERRGAGPPHLRRDRRRVGGPRRVRSGLGGCADACCAPDPSPTLQVVPKPPRV